MTDFWDNQFYAGEASKFPRCPFEFVWSFVARHTDPGCNRGDIKILEVGCGAGPNLLFLHQQGYDVTGIDCSEHALAEAHNRRLHANASHIGWRTFLADLRKPLIFFPDSTFDLVIDRGALSSLALFDAITAIQETHRVLKPGGHFLFNPYSTRHDSMFTGWAMDDGRRQNFQLGGLRNYAGSMRFYSRVGVDAVLRDGFEIERIEHVETSDETVPGMRRVSAEWRVEARKRD